MWMWGFDFGAVLEDLVIAAGRVKVLFLICLRPLCGFEESLWRLFFPIAKKVGLESCPFFSLQDFFEVSGNTAELLSRGSPENTKNYILLPKNCKSLALEECLIKPSDGDF
jgi:hypothetical protein